MKIIVETLKLTLSEIQSKNFYIRNEINQLKRTFQYQVRISSLFREIEVTLNLLYKQLVQLQEALDVTATGQFNSMFIKPAK